jgi:hypothetical protein
MKVQGKKIPIAEGLLSMSCFKLSFRVIMNKAAGGCLEAEITK